MTALPRDSQRASVYQAEQLVHGLFDHAVAGRAVDVFGVSMTLPPEARFASVDSVQSYVDRVVGPGAVRVRARAGASSAHYEHSDGARPVIAVPAGRDGVWALRELVILHELAHHVVASADAAADAGDAATSPREGTPAGAHGGAFAAAFIDLATRTMGPEVGLALRIVYAESGVAVG